jgi:hypothetical protein
MMASQNRNGMIQFLSLRCTTTPAIHHLILLGLVCQCSELDDLPSEEHSNEDVDRQSEFPVKNRWRVPWFLYDLWLAIGRAPSNRLLVIIGKAAILLNVVVGVDVCVVAMLNMRVLSAWLQELADLLISGARGVDYVRAVFVGGARAVVHVLVDMLLSDVECWVVVPCNAGHRRSVVLAIGHDDNGHEGNSLE